MMDMKNFFSFRMGMVLFAALLLFGPGAQTVTAADVLVVGVSDDIPPMVFRDRGAELIGYDVDLLNEIGRRINKRRCWVVPAGCRVWCWECFANPR